MRIFVLFIRGIDILFICEMFSWISSKKIDFFTLVREGDDDKIKEYISNLQDLTAIENAINLDPSLVRLVGGQVRRLDDNQNVL